MPQMISLSSFSSRIIKHPLDIGIVRYFFIIKPIDFNRFLEYLCSNRLRDGATSCDGKGRNMTIYGKEKRKQGRVKREYMVDIKVGNENKKIYSIDLSEGGVKVGGAMLMLKPGEQVDLSVEKDGVKYAFRGQVERNDGNQRINRIGCDANVFFIRILDERFPEFVRTILR